jgi:predicted GNAT family N-acyltransferase
MTSLEQANKEAKDFLHRLLKPGKSSWTADGIQGHVLKTVNDGNIVSAIIYQQLTHNENWVFIHALGTSMEQRKKGHVRALLENLMKKDGAPHMICLEAISGDSDLLQIYGNLGFIPSSTHDKQIQRDIKSLGKGGNKTLILDNKA